MNIHCFRDNDSLYIEFSPTASVGSEELAPGFVFDFDKDGGIVGIDIGSNASKLVDLSKIEFTIVPIKPA